MNVIALTDLLTNWWDSLNPPRQIFYGIGLVASFVALVLTALGVFGGGHDDALDGASADVDHGGGDFVSIKPLTGFFLGFGWAGGVALDSGLTIIVALLCAILAGGLMMGLIVVMFRAIYSMRSDGTMRINDALGAIGTVYVTLPPAKASGGQVTVNFHGRQETFAALNVTAHAIPSGDKVKVLQIVDGRTVLVEPLA